MADQWTDAGFTREAPTASPDAWEAAGFTREASPDTKPEQLSMAPAAVVQRLQDGKDLSLADNVAGARDRLGTSLTSIWDATKKGYDSGLDAKGFADTWAARTNFTAKNISPSNPLSGPVEMGNTALKGLDAASHLLNGVIGAAGSALGQAFGEAIGAQGQTEGFKETATQGLSIGLPMRGSRPGPLVGMKDGRLARVEVSEATGKVEAEPLGPMPTPEMMQKTATLVNSLQNNKPMTFPTSMEGVRLTSEKAGLEERAAVLKKEEAAIPPDDLSTKDRLNRLNTVEDQLMQDQPKYNNGQWEPQTPMDPAMKKQLKDRRDQILVNTTPEALKAGADAIEARRTNLSEQQAITERLAEVDKQLEKQPPPPSNFAPPKEDPAVSTERKVNSYWQDQGTHPTEVAEAAAQSPAMARDLSSASTPPFVLTKKAFSGWLSQLNDRFFGLGGKDKAEKLRFLDFARTLPESLKNDEVQKKWYMHAEGDPLAEPMTPAEQDGYNKYFLPLRKREYDAYDQFSLLKDPNHEHEVAASDPRHMHRMIKGRTPEIDRYAGEGQEGNPTYGPGLFSRKPSGANARSYFAIVSPYGDRQLVSIQGNKVSAVTKGQPHLELEHDLPDKQIVPGDRLTIQGVQWDVDHAYTREIEENTSHRYYQNAVANSIDNILHLESATRAMYEIQHLKSSDEWAVATSGPDATATPNMPMFQNDRMHPRLANVIDNYWGGANSDKIEAAVHAINRASIGTLFWNPIVHMANVGSDWFVARSWDNFTPAGYVSLFVDGAKAIREVTTMGDTYQRLLRNGNSLELAGLRTKDYYDKLLKQLGSDMVNNPHEGWADVLANSGASPITLGRKWMEGSSNALWAVSDMFMVQHVLSLERKGLSTAQAITQAERFIANYRTPPESSAALHSPRMSYSIRCCSSSAAIIGAS